LVQQEDRPSEDIEEELRRDPLVLSKKVGRKIERKVGTQVGSFGLEQLNWKKD
jgi:hypothetical protein